jgi:putative tricarboxylic transport membrane protein
MNERNNNTSRPWWTLVDRTIGIVFALLAIIALLNLWNSKLVLWDRYGPGPTFVPYIVASILLAVCIPIIVSRNRVTFEQFGSSPAATVKYVVTVIVLVLLFPLLGAFLSIAIFSLLELFWVERFRLRRALVVSAVTVFVVWVIFSLMLSVPFPSGPFDFEDWWR